MEKMRATSMLFFFVIITVVCRVHGGILGIPVAESGPKTKPVASEADIKTEDYHRPHTKEVKLNLEDSMFSSPLNLDVSKVCIVV